MKKRFLSLIACALAVSVSLSCTAFAEKLPPDNDPIPEPNTIFGTDNRQVVTNTSAKGANAVCNLTLTFKNPKTGKNVTKYGTGFMYSRYNMGTAGHCIWDPSLDTYVSTMKIMPGDNANGGIVGAKTVSYSKSNFHVPEEYVNNGKENPNFDYGVVVLSEPFPSPVGYFGLDHEFTDEQYETEYLNLSGYDYKSRTQYKERSNKKVVNVNPIDVQMKFDTLPGMSGSPIYTDDRYVVGLYNYGATGSDVPVVDEDYDKNYNYFQKLGNDVSKEPSEFYKFLKQYYIKP